MCQKGYRHYRMKKILIGGLFFAYLLYCPLGPDRHQIIQLNPLAMRKADIVTRVSEMTGVPKVDVLVTLEAFFKEVKESLKAGENVYVRGFGSFVTKKRAQKIGRIIKRNESIVIPAHYIPAFKPAKTFSDEVKNGRKPGDEQENGQE